METPEQLVVLTKAATGQEIVDAAKQIAGKHYYEITEVRGLVLCAGQKSTNLSRNLLLRVDGSSTIELGKRYNRVLVTEFQWIVEEPREEYDQKEAKKVVNDFAAALQEHLTAK
jgi:hypothetical protein